MPEISYRALKSRVESLEQSVTETERLRVLANIDGLTGLFNRGYLESARIEIESDLRITSATVIMLDIDHMKEINDSLEPNPYLDNLVGHPAGDEILRRVANITRRCIRDEDIAARYGGDEFAILLLNINQTGQIDEIITRLENSFREANLAVSIGYTSATRHARLDLDTAFKSADRNLYHHKHCKNNHHPPPQIS